MGGGGKGGKTESTVQIDPQLQAASRDALDYAATAARLPFTPNRGVQIAAPTSQMTNSMQGTNAAASAFGMNPQALNMPQTTMGANGIQGYTTGELYDQAKNASYSPAMQQSIDELFIDPQDGLIRENRSPIYEPHYGGGKGQPAQPGLPNRYPYSNPTPASQSPIPGLPYTDPNGQPDRR